MSSPRNKFELQPLNQLSSHHAVHPLHLAATAPHFTITHADKQKHPGPVIVAFCLSRSITADKTNMTARTIAASVNLHHQHVFLTNSNAHQHCRDLSFWPGTIHADSSAPASITHANLLCPRIAPHQRTHARPASLHSSQTKQPLAQQYRNPTPAPQLLTLPTAAYDPLPQFCSRCLYFIRHQAWAAAPLSNQRTPSHLAIGHQCHRQAVATLNHAQQKYVVRAVRVTNLARLSIANTTSQPDATSTADPMSAAGREYMPTTRPCPQHEQTHGHIKLRPSNTGSTHHIAKVTTCARS